METPQLRFLTALVVLTATSGFLLAPVDSVHAAPTTCSAADAAAWLDANVRKLPSTLSDIEQFDPVYRKAILSRLDPKARAAVWREHLAAVVRDTAVKLSPEQRAALDFIDGRLESLFTSTDGGDLEEMAAHLAVFDSSLRTRLFYSIGRRSNANPVCNCNFNRNDCGGGGPGGPNESCEHEMHPDYACVPTSFGCGLFWIEECDGHCNMGAQ